MLAPILVILCAIATFYYLRLVRQESYDRGFIAGHADAANKLRDAMDHCQPPF